ncbi:hypothetical protein Daus18300_009411 [Diaporthe australafricana]|uniref:Secreted protein n=1 Tax=Diaporthe australafricana TaxID=127596 RepID=A0ABR3WEE3_9PEZI
MRLAIVASLAAVAGLSTGLPLGTNNTSGTNITLLSANNYDINSNPAAPLNITTNDLEYEFFSLFSFSNNSEHASDIEPGLEIVPRDKGLPPRSRKVAEQMKYGLPECYQRCFKNENGKVGVDIYTWDLGRYCTRPGCLHVEEWGYTHIYPCFKWQCRKESKKTKLKAGKWTADTCGDFCKI